MVQVDKYCPTDGSGNFSFVNQTGGGGGGATTLGALTDVSSTAPSTGQVLKWSGTEWAPAVQTNINWW